MQGSECNERLHHKLGSVVGAEEGRGAVHTSSRWTSTDVHTLHGGQEPHLCAEPGLGILLKLYKQAILLIPEAVVVCIYELQQLVPRPPDLPRRFLLKQLLHAWQGLGCTKVPARSGGAVSFCGQCGETCGSSRQLSSLWSGCDAIQIGLSSVHGAALAQPCSTSHQQLLLELTKFGTDCQAVSPVSETFACSSYELIAFTVSGFGPSLAVIWTTQLNNTSLPVALLAYELVDLVIQVPQPAEDRLNRLENVISAGRALHKLRSSLVLSQASVLYLHDLLANLLDNLVSPLVSLVEVDALCGQVGTLLLRSSLLILFSSQEPVEHRLGLLFISGHLARIGTSPATMLFVRGPDTASAALFRQAVGWGFPSPPSTSCPRKQNFRATGLFGLNYKVLDFVIDIMSPSKIPLKGQSTIRRSEAFHQWPPPASQIFQPPRLSTMTQPPNQRKTVKQTFSGRQSLTSCVLCPACSDDLRSSVDLCRRDLVKLIEGSLLDFQHHSLKTLLECVETLLRLCVNAGTHEQKFQLVRNVGTSPWPAVP